MRSIIFRHPYSHHYSSVILRFGLVPISEVDGLYSTCKISFLLRISSHRILIIGTVAQIGLVKERCAI